MLTHFYPYLSEKKNISAKQKGLPDVITGNWDITLWTKQSYPYIGSIYTDTVSSTVALKKLT
jgi:hypothetical protein